MDVVAGSGLALLRVHAPETLDGGQQLRINCAEVAAPPFPAVPLNT